MRANGTDFPEREKPLKGFVSSNRLEPSRREPLLSGLPSESRSHLPSAAGPSGSRAAKGEDEVEGNRAAFEELPSLKQMRMLALLGFLFLSLFFLFLVMVVVPFFFQRSSLREKVS